MSIYSVFGPRVPLDSESSGSTQTNRGFDPSNPLSFLLEQQQEQDNYPHTQSDNTEMDLQNLYPRRAPPSAPPKSAARPSGAEHKRRPSAPHSAVHVLPNTPDESEESKGPLDERDHVKEASLEIIPLLLSSPPSIPPALKSAELKQRHKILSISPYDIEDYLVTTVSSNKRGLAEEAITNLETLKAHVDQLAGIVATETSAMSGIIRSIKFLSPEKGTLMACVDLGEYDSNPGLVSMILKNEADVNRKQTWKFHNLLPCGASRGSWVENAKDALAPHHQPQESAPSQHQSLAPGHADPRFRQTSFNDKSLDRARSHTSTSAATDQTADSYKTSLDSPRGNDETQNHAEQEDSEQLKPQHYTDAEDFWGGWDDDEVAKDDGDKDQQKAEEDNEDDYWNSYDAQDPYDESQKRYAEEMQRQHQMELDTASQMGSVHFDNLERREREAQISMPGDYFGPEATPDSSREAAQPYRGGTDSVIKRSIPEEDKSELHRPSAFDEGLKQVPNAVNAINAASIASTGMRSQATVSAAARSSSPSSASTDMGRDDEERDGMYDTRDSDQNFSHTDDGSVSHDVTTVAGTEDDRYTQSITTKDLESNDASAGDSLKPRDSRLGFAKSTDTGTQQDGETQSSSDPASNRRAQDVNLGEGREPGGGTDPSRKGIDEVEQPQATSSAGSNQNPPSPAGKPADSRTANTSASLPFAYQPPPMSITGQSTFETPEDMTLADLEAFYRGRDQQRMIETRERISRLHHTEDRDEKQGEDNENADEDDGDAKSAIDEARSALGEVVPDYTGLPGFGPTQPPSRPPRPASQPAEARSSRPQHERHPSSDKPPPRGPQSDADPIEALAQADPSLAFNAGDDDNKERSHSGWPHSGVSMDTLRKLAEENRLSGPGITSKDAKGKPGQKSEETSTSGKSKSGGFKNFLQLAPSTVYTDAELEEQPDDEDDTPPPAPSEAANPPSPVPEDQEREMDDPEASYETEKPEHGSVHSLDYHEPGKQGEEEEAASDNFSIQEDRSDGTASDADLGQKPQDQSNDRKSKPSETGEVNNEVASPDLKHSNNSASSPKRKDTTCQDDFDMNAFMFPLQAEEKRRKGAHLDSPGLDDNDPAAREVFTMMNGQRKGAHNWQGPPSTNNQYSASETFLPGAASDASVRPLRGTVIHRIHERDSETDITDIREEGEESIGKPASRPPASAKPREQSHSFDNDSKAVGVNSTSTELGLAEIESEAPSQGRQSVAPGPQWRGAAPPPGSTSQHTANLRHEHLKWQRQQALQSQRNRIQQQRAQQGLFQNDQDDNEHLVNVEADDIPAPLARGAAQRAPFPGKDNNNKTRSMGPSSRPGPMRHHTASENPNQRRAQPWEPYEKVGEERENDQEEGSQNGNYDGPDMSAAAAAALPSPVDPSNQTDYTPSPANATWNASRGQDGVGSPAIGPRAGQSDLQPPPTPRAASRKDFQSRQHEARVHAGAAAARRREILKRVSKRNDHAKSLLKSFIHIINDGDSPMAENDFMRLARESFRECSREKEDLIANGGDGKVPRPGPSGRTPSHRGKKGGEVAEQQEEEQEDGGQDRGLNVPQITVNGDEEE
ncbi:unnamed protein product [Sympodiomycopsis kandeliae]